MTALDRLYRDCSALGTILFTVTGHDFDAMLFRRVYSSHPSEYPATGTKPMLRDDWFDLCITQGRAFVANTPKEFSALFFDHALIVSMGLGSAANLPVRNAAGLVIGTVNLLAGQGHFTPARVADYAALVAQAEPALAAALA